MASFPVRVRIIRPAVYEKTNSGTIKKKRKSLITAAVYGEKKKSI